MMTKKAATTNTNTIVEDDNEDDGGGEFIAVTDTPAYRRGRHNRHQKKVKNNKHNKTVSNMANDQDDIYSSSSHKPVINVTTGEIQFKEIPHFYKGEELTVSKTLLSMQHSSAIQNHILNDENLYHLEFTVAKASGIQGHYYIGDETGSVLWIANNAGQFYGYFPLGSQICTKHWKQSFITLQLKYKAIKDATDPKRSVYSPICHLLINKEQPFVTLPMRTRCGDDACTATMVGSSESSHVLLHCGVIAVNKNTGKVLIGKRTQTDHFAECISALEYHFNERSKQRYAPLRHSFLCHAEGLKTWTDRELESIAHFHPKYSEGAHREGWRKYWIFDETLMQLSLLADAELTRRRGSRGEEWDNGSASNSDERSMPSNTTTTTTTCQDCCWSFPVTTSAYKIESKRYKLEMHHETAKRAFQHETGTQISLKPDCPFLDHKCIQVVEKNHCFDRYFIHFVPFEESIKSKSAKSHQFSKWRWIPIEKIVTDADGMYNDHLKSILQKLQAKLNNLE